MVKQKINPDDEPPATPDPEALAEMDGEGAGTALAAPTSMALGQMAGDQTLADLKFPRLQIAYGVGGLATDFTPGDLVLDKEHLLAKKKTPIRIVVLNTLTYWKEYTTFGSGAMPRTAKTREEVHRMGCTTDWGPNSEPPQFKRAMDLRLLIRKPEGLVCGLFGLELGGASWAPAQWSVDKMAFDRVNDKLTPVANFALREKGLLYGSWDLSTDVETLKKSGNVVCVPVLKYVGLNDDKLVADIRAVFAPGS